jgi:antitoxin YefM
LQQKEIDLSAPGVSVISGIRQRVIVGEGGTIEVLAPDLPKGTTVEVIVFIEPEERDTTDYLLSTEANRRHLLQALEDLEDRSRYTHVDADDL